MGCKNMDEKCPCTANCELHGSCCDCVKKHNARGEFPGCFFSKQGELKQDRSFETLLQDRGIKV